MRHALFVAAYAALAPLAFTSSSAAAAQPQLLPLAGRAGLAANVEFLHPAPGSEADGADLADLVARLYRAGLDPDCVRWVSRDDEQADHDLESLDREAIRRHQREKFLAIGRNIG